MFGKALSKALDEGSVDENGKKIRHHSIKLIRYAVWVCLQKFKLGNNTC